MSSKFYTIDPNFKPAFIISQIILIFSIFYIIFILFTLLFNALFGINLHMYQILSCEGIDFSSNNIYYCYANLLTLVFTHIFMIFINIIMIDKPKKMLDYILTNFFLHLILTTLYSHFPNYISWWFTYFIILFGVTIISESIAMRIRQKPIYLNISEENKV